jgi:addiction module HigA family antidote
MSKLEPVTPGELLYEEFIKPMGLSQYRLAKEIGVPAQRIIEIIAASKNKCLLALRCAWAPGLSGLEFVL